MARSKNEIVWTGDSAQLIQDLEKLKTNYGKLEQRIRETGKSGSRTQSVLGSIGAQVTSMASGWLSVNAAISAGRALFRMWDEDVKKFAESAKAARESMMDLYFLEGAKPGSFEATAREAAGHMVRPTEYGPAKEAFVSGTAGMDKTRQADLWRLAMQHRRLSRLPPEQIAGFYGKAGLMFQGRSPQDIQNFIITTIKQAGATAEAIGPQFPRVMALAGLGKMEQEELGALFAAATQASGTPRQAAGGLESMVRGMMIGGPASAGILKGAGVTEGMSFMERLQAVQRARAAGTISDEQLATLIGTPGMRLTKLTDTDILAPHLQAFRAVRGRRLGSEMVAAAAKDPSYRRAMQWRQLEAEEEAVEATTHALADVERYGRALDVSLKRGGAAPIHRYLSQMNYRFGTFLGADPARAAELGAFTQEDSFGAVIQKLDRAADNLQQGSGDLRGATGGLNIKSKTHLRDVQGGG